jgi:hypothetical protein
MLHDELYERVSKAYTDMNEDLDIQFQDFADPTQTVENALRVMKTAKKRYEQFEWKMFFYFGKAIHRTIQTNFGMTIAKAGSTLDLNRRQVQTATRVFDLFETHEYALDQFSGISPNELMKIADNSFRATLRSLQRDFPPVEEVLDF